MYLQRRGESLDDCLSLEAETNKFFLAPFIYSRINTTLGSTSWVTHVLFVATTKSWEYTPPVYCLWPLVWIHYSVLLLRPQTVHTYFQFIGVATNSTHVLPICRSSHKQCTCTPWPQTVQGRGVLHSDWGRPLDEPL